MFLNDMHTEFKITRVANGWIVTVPPPPAKNEIFDQVAKGISAFKEFLPKDDVMDKIREDMEDKVSEAVKPPEGIQPVPNVHIFDTWTGVKSFLDTQTNHL